MITILLCTTRTHRRDVFVNQGSISAGLLLQHVAKIGREIFARWTTHAWLCACHLWRRCQSPPLAIGGSALYSDDEIWELFSFVSFCTSLSIVLYTWVYHVWYRYMPACVSVSVFLPSLPLPLPLGFWNEKLNLGKTQKRSVRRRKSTVKVRN